jgi:hypothetical protein
MLKNIFFWFRAKKAHHFILCYGLIVLAFSTEAVMDNRYRDNALMRYPFLVEDLSAFFLIQPFLETAHDAFDQYGKTTGQFDFGTHYRLREVERALLASGRIDDRIIPTNMQGNLVIGPYLMDGRIETQGIAFQVYAPLSNCFAVGARGEFLHGNSRMEMTRDVDFDRVINGPGDEREVFLIKEQAAKALDLDPASWSAFMVGDLELYGRIFTSMDHAYKCRYFNAGANLGMILPAADARDINNPASIPLGGNRHWAVFGEASIDAILKQNIRAGLWIRLQHRFSRQSELRVPTAREPEMFGAVVGQIEVEPGLTGAFSPYFLFEELREGFGAYVSYMLVGHKEDSFCDRRKDKTVPINFDALTCVSDWGLEYISVAFLYDFSYGHQERCLNPIVSLKVDAPVHFLLTKRASKTYGASLVVEASF